MANDVAKNSEDEKRIKKPMVGAVSPLELLLACGHSHDQVAGHFR